MDTIVTRITVLNNSFVLCFSFLEHFETPVCVKCMWDDPRLHIEGPPLYILWQKRDSLPQSNSLIDSNPFNKT